METTITWYTVFVSVWIISAIIGHGERNGFWHFVFWLLTAGALFWVGWKVTDGNVIISVILAAVLFALIVAARAMIEKNKRMRQEKLYQEQREDEKRREDAKKQAALERQKELEDKYANSPLTREIIQTIRGGSNDLPEEIVVYDDRVTGCTNGVTRTYGFIANRVESLKRVFDAEWDPKHYELLLRPQVALGNAINRILGGEYDVSDEAIRQSEVHTDCDDEIHTLFQYTSDHVLLRLKPKTYF